MKLLLRSKHQRLILQCYPPGKSVDKKPNPSELSYLLYYATTRRTKLLKVGVFLQKKVINDYNHNRTGNLLVSLDIIKGLIDKCSENLDAFAINLLVIFKHILMTNDLALCQYLLPIFSSFCKQIKSDIFNGDLDFINQFEDVCQKFVSFGYKAVLPNENEWTILSLQSIQSFSPTLAYNNGLTEVLVNYSMPLILSNIYEIDKQELDSHLNPDGGANELKKLSTIKHVTTAVSNTQDVPMLASETVEGEAYRSLNSFFDTTSNSTGNQLQNSSNALIDYMIANNASESWANRLIQLSVNWIPVSSRFRFLDSLFRKLIMTNDRKTKMTLTGQVSGLLSSPVTLISLDVPGTLKLLCREQMSLLENIKSHSDELIVSYTNCIKSLTSHLYYRNQVSDIISGLLKECSDYYDNYPIDEDKYRNCVMVLFADIKALLNKPYSESNESLSLDIWEDTFTFLLIEDDTLVKIYGHLLLDYLNLEVRNAQLYTKPNFSKYITNQFNPLSQFFQYINDYFNSFTADEFDNSLDILVTVTIKLIKRYGINTIANGLPFFFQWQLRDMTQIKKIDLAKDSFLFIFLYESSKFLEIEGLDNIILSKQLFRESNNLVYATNYKFDVTKMDNDPFITKEMIESKITDKSILLSWLNLDAKQPYKDEYNSLMNISKQPSLIQINNNNTAESENNRVVTSSGSTPSITTPTTTTNLNGLEQNHESILSTFQNRSFTPTSSFQPKPSPKVIDLKHAISGNSLRLTSFGGGSSIRQNGGFTSSVVSSRIMDDVGSLLLELDIDGDLSSDEDGNYSKGRLVR